MVLRRWGKGPSLELPGGLSMAIAVSGRSRTGAASRVAPSGADGATRLLPPTLGLPCGVSLPQTRDMCRAIHSNEGSWGASRKPLGALAPRKSCRWWRHLVKGMTASPSWSFPVRAEVAALGPFRHRRAVSCLPQPAGRPWCFC